MIDRNKAKIQLNSLIALNNFTAGMAVFEVDPDNNFKTCIEYIKCNTFICRDYLDNDKDYLYEIEE